MIWEGTFHSDSKSICVAVFGVLGLIQLSNVAPRFVGMQGGCIILFSLRLDHASMLPHAC